ncbi:MAG: hypothetical protein AB7D07_01970 [Desulfovibrionaceae bacterium]
MSTPIKERIQETKGRTCEVPFCFNETHRFGRLCSYHENIEQRTGHPLGSTIRKATLRPYQQWAMSWLDENRGEENEALRKMLEVLETILNQAKPMSILDPGTPGQRLNDWLHALHSSGVAPLEIVATMTGMFLMQELEPGLFKSDRHFGHQVAVRVFRLAPAPTGRTGRQRYSRITTRTRDRFMELFVRSRVGANCLAFSRRMIQEREAARDPVERELARM